ncbi:hypothetical protein IAR50_004856 [Cryptococcus sp. DSM 104548]
MDRPPISSGRPWTRIVDPSTEGDPPQYRWRDNVDKWEVLTVLDDDDKLFTNDENMVSSADTTVYILSSIAFDDDEEGHRTLSRMSLIAPRKIEGTVYDTYQGRSRIASQMEQNIIKCLDKATDSWLHDSFVFEDTDILANKVETIASLLKGDNEQYRQVQLFNLSEEQFEDLERSVYNDDEGEEA